MTTIGVEFELCSSYNIRDLVKILQERGIDIYYVDPKQPTSTYWKAEKDYSVICSGKDRFGKTLNTIEKTKASKKKIQYFPIELVSPVLTNMKVLKSFLNHLHKLPPSYKINQTQGFHVHISNSHLQLPKFETNGFGVQWVAAFCVNWTAFERFILSKHHPVRMKSPHSRSLMSNLLYKNRMEDFNTLNVNDKTLSFSFINDLFNPRRNDFGSGKVYPKGQYHDINVSHGRNSVVNLSNLRNKNNRKGTIEIRSHEGTVDIVKILNHIKTVKALFKNAYNRKTKTFIDVRHIILDKYKKPFQKCSIQELESVFNQFVL